MACINIQLMARLSVLGLLLLQTILFAVAPAPLLMLAGHDHIVVGVLTEEQWRDHEHAHWLAAMAQAGQVHKHTTHTPSSSEAHIFSSETLHSAVSARARGAIALPASASAAHAPPIWEEFIASPSPAVHPTAIDVPHPPPRAAST